MLSCKYLYNLPIRKRISKCLKTDKATRLLFQRKCASIITLFRLIICITDNMIIKR